MDKDPAVTLTGRATADPARDGPLVPDLVTRARTGDKQAWDALVERYAPLIWSICCKYRLGRFRGPVRRARAPCRHGG
jgi:hypothetical protein